jgi:hypothetical protein
MKNIMFSAIYFIAVCMVCCASFPTFAQTVGADGSGSIATASVAQQLFSGSTPPHGFQVCHMGSSGTLWVSDVGTASIGGSSFGLTVGQCYTTPMTYRSPGAVSALSSTAGLIFAARAW